MKRDILVAGGVGALCGFALSFLKKELAELAWKALPTATNWDEVEDVCIWCHAQMPRTEEPDEDYYRECAKWVMVSYGDRKKHAVVACSPLHMELYLMIASL